MSTTSLPTTGPLTVVEYNLRAARRWWRSLVVTGVATPVLYVLALGVGLGVAVNRNSHGTLGVPYLVFVAPARTLFLLRRPRRRRPRRHRPPPRCPPPALTAAGIVAHWPARDGGSSRPRH